MQFNARNIRPYLFFIVVLLGLLAMYQFFSASLLKNQQNEKLTNSLHRGRHFQFDLHQWNFSKTCEQNNPHKRPECDSCEAKPELWSCVGEGRGWGAAFVDIRPLELRGPTSLRMAKNAQIVISHDTNWDLAIWPEDWKKTQNSEEPRMDGRRVFTDKSQIPWASFIQGDLDPTGEIFDAAVAKFKSGEVDKYYDEFNPDKSGWGSHIKILAAAALSTQGDILECGTGFFSTPLLNKIVKETQVEGRILVSADTELNWLHQFKKLTGPNHQIIGVPVYEDGASCGKYMGGGGGVLPLAEIAFEGRIEKGLKTNKDISCPEKLYDEF